MLALARQLLCPLPVSAHMRSVSVCVVLPVAVGAMTAVAATSGEKQLHMVSTKEEASERRNRMSRGRVVVVVARVRSLLTNCGIEAQARISFSSRVRECVDAKW